MSDHKKVLIVDDEIDLCNLLKNYFVRKGYEASCCHTLKDGINMLESYRPDILFLDNNLPDGEGWKNAPALSVQYPGTYFALVSAYHPTHPPMPATSRYCIIEKPISIADLDRHFFTV